MSDRYENEPEEFELDPARYEGHTRDMRVCEMVETDMGRVWPINGYCEIGIRGDARLAEVYSIEANAKLWVDSPKILALAVAQAAEIERLKQALNIIHSNAAESPEWIRRNIDAFQCLAALGVSK